MTKEHYCSEIHKSTIKRSGYTPFCRHPPTLSPSSIFTRKSWAPSLYTMEILLDYQSKWRKLRKKPPVTQILFNFLFRDSERHCSVSRLCGLYWWVGLFFLEAYSEPCKTFKTAFCENSWRISYNLCHDCTDSVIYTP